VQFSKNKDSPQQSPELIRIGKGNTAADSDVLGGVLLEQIADDPDETAEHEPENHGAGREQFLPKRRQTLVADR
jgi:hypothetical protein